MDLTVLSIFQKVVTFDHNLTHLHDLFVLILKYFFVGIYISNEKVWYKTFVSLKIVELLIKKRLISNKSNAYR